MIGWFFEMVVDMSLHDTWLMDVFLGEYRDDKAR